MSSNDDNFAIRVEGLGKRYRIGQREPYKTLRDSLMNVFRPRRKTAGETKQAEGEDAFWALRDVSFEVPRGEVVGIIGRNGAGKSTLLKILSRITEPTTGRVEITGRVGSLLEVGTGFHPELTGRENVFLNGAILGMREHEIRTKFDEIVAFSEIEKFIDTPVKRYSSGMYTRLAFAVAAHLEPEILIVDEVLAVGDASFQKKCLGKMKDVAGHGRTVLFVSHNMTAVGSLCDHAVWLDHGSNKLQGIATDVIEQYLLGQGRGAGDQSWDDPQAAPGNELVKLRRLAAHQVDAGAAGCIDPAKPMEIEVDFWNARDGLTLHVTLLVFTNDETCAFATNSPPRACPAGVVRTRCMIPDGLLNGGIYRVQVLVVRDHGTLLFDFGQAIAFEVNEQQHELRWYGKWPGAVRPRLHWETNVELVAVDEGLTTVP